MNPSTIIEKLNTNLDLFNSLFNSVKPAIQVWREAEDKWNMLEIVCHLVDEEREDFRQRLQLVLHDPGLPFPSINPAGWVNERKYASNDFQVKVNEFVAERKKSVQWLSSLNKPKWENTHPHPTFGPMSASFILANWLAHDYLHMRQLIRLQYQYLLQEFHQPLSYAGNW